MDDPIEFTSNYSDLSTDHGFQFEFNCDRCGNGFRTTFKPFALGNVNSVLDTASNLLGGLFGSAADVSSRMTEAQRERAREEAFTEAVKQIKPHFIQCPNCMAWVCRKSCWNEKRGLCKTCAPDLAVEMSAAQASKTREAVWENAAVSEEEQKVVKSQANWKQTLQATCPKCGAPLAQNAKFCPECGEKLQKVAFCPECGAKLTPGAKFCGECGRKL